VLCEGQQLLREGWKRGVLTARKRRATARRRSRRFTRAKSSPPSRSEFPARPATQLAQPNSENASRRTQSKSLRISNFHFSNRELLVEMTNRKPCRSTRNCQSSRSASNSLKTKDRVCFYPELPVAGPCQPTRSQLCVLAPAVSAAGGWQRYHSLRKMLLKIEKSLHDAQTDAERRYAEARHFHGHKSRRVTIYIAELKAIESLRPMAHARFVKSRHLTVASRYGDDIYTPRARPRLLASCRYRSHSPKELACGHRCAGIETPTRENAN
jgi:hypothetical protein